MVEVAQHVVRIRRLCKLRLMARVAVCVDKLIIPVRMTLLTLCCGMPSGQRKSRCVMIECRTIPAIR